VSSGGLFSLDFLNGNRDDEKKYAEIPNCTLCVIEFCLRASGLIRPAMRPY